MKLYSINTGHFKLDGGAMFGVVPKSLWQKQNPADENNMCSWAMRCLLIETEDRLILVDNGMGNKQDDKFFGYYYLHGEDSLTKSLAKYGFSPTDITDNIVTHLHFDHCGGGVQWNADRTKYELTFPNANYWVNRQHWDAAMQPNPREKASFLKENILPMQESGHLKFVNGEKELFPGISLLYSNGHTDAMMLPVIQYQDKKIIFLADLIPSSYHVPTAWVMGYDIRPLQTMEEKLNLLPQCAEEGSILFFEHDPVTECCTVENTERGIKIKDRFALNEIR
ncbi:MAG: MBL fold metallo-hydrolase [Bacteroidetes bacterium]|nr:MBL fold metallo-hydrolase [Bacteroidota bacterium]